METPVCKTSAVTQLPENTNCLAWSEDGQYLSVGHSRGLSVWVASSFTCVAEWSQERLEITSIQITRLAEKTYLLGTIDDMGVARVLVFWSKNIHLLNIINVMENINNRSICLSFQLSQGGDYGVASISCNGAVWLEVFHFPLEAWLKELGTIISQKQDSNSSVVSEVQWTPVAVINKIKPIQTVSDTVSKSSSQFYTRCFAVDGKMSSPAGPCTAHFLLPLSGESKEKTGFPNAVCMWWSGSHNLLQYSLLKTTKNKSDWQSFPSLLWPNANKIVCSAVSGSSRYIGLGLTDAVVCVWDRHFGSPLSVLSLSEAYSDFSRIHFVDYCPVSPNHSHSCSAELHLSVLCKSGAMYAVIMGRGSEFRILQLAERVKDSSDLPTVAAAVPFLQGLSLVIQRNGKMFLQDVINKTNVCSLILPSTHVLAMPCNPVFALNSQHCTLVIQGDPDPFSKEDCYSQLYIFRFEECDIVKPYIITPTDSSKQQETCSFITLEDSCNQYLQKRMLSANVRTKNIRQTWLQLQETSVMLQQRMEMDFPFGHYDSSVIVGSACLRGPTASHQPRD